MGCGCSSARLRRISTSGTSEAGHGCISAGRLFHRNDTGYFGYFLAQSPSRHRFATIGVENSAGDGGSVIRDQEQRRAGALIVGDDAPHFSLKHLSRNQPSDTKRKLKTSGTVARKALQFH